MYKVCRTERSANRQKLIEETLLSIMREKRFEDITVTELCEKMNMPRKAFYRYFDGIDSALVGLVEHTLADFKAEKIDMNGIRSLQKELEAFFVFWQKQRNFLETLDKSGVIGALMQSSLSFPIGSIISLERLLPDEEPALRATIYRFAISGLISIVLDWYRDGFRISVPEMARVAIRILTKPPFPNLDKLGITDAD